MEKKIIYDALDDLEKYIKKDELRLLGQNCHSCKFEAAALTWKLAEAKADANTVVKRAEFTKKEENLKRENTKLQAERDEWEEMLVKF
ncbi:UNVERIFIED_CONTAM: hypothetical protein K2H54_024221 [Gekko kuhli]